MPPESGQTRTLYLPRTGTKVSLLIGLAVVLAAIFAAVAPLSVHSATSPDLGCGNAVKPVSDSFGKAYCKQVVKAGQYRAGGLLIGGLLLGGAGAALFGFDTSTRTRKPRPGWEDGYDDGYDDDWDESPRSRRRGDGRDVEESGRQEKRSDAGRTPGRSAAARPASARTGGASATSGRAAPVAGDRADVDETPAAAVDEPDTAESQNSLRRPFGDRFADRNRRRVDVDEDDHDDEYDQQDGPRGRR
ncbi:hypothetical protein [Allobranchiibius sp. GilTou73]|uniref:hypothetical protein n=1 Tax=Allobranchiibius sp. GilTou73 TaxID=2904523 RepID=UPI001F20D52B|nr:hypothetical protein [Allobranchiibius sp. GilTou73]UIJ33819.1 hypothetical protein LVQ62_11735 [Allobranchiibius sp. GilTou73]